MTKSEAINNAPEHYRKYIQLASDEHLLDQLDGGGIDLYVDDLEKLEEIGDRVYAPGKWTIKEMIQHLIDTERVFAYRVLRFARKDTTELPGFDENLYASNCDVSGRKLADLLEEYQILRLSNIYLFKRLTDDDLCILGSANSNKISIGSIGYVLIGHAIHHHNIIKERYLGLIDS